MIKPDSKESDAQIDCLAQDDWERQKPHLVFGSEPGRAVLMTIAVGGSQSKCSFTKTHLPYGVVNYL